MVYSLIVLAHGNCCFLNYNLLLPYLSEFYIKTNINKFCLLSKLI